MRLHAGLQRLLCRQHNAEGPARLCRRGSSQAGSGRKTYDVVIAGGGIMGSSSAYFLAQRIPPSSICVVERDSKVHVNNVLIWQINYIIAMITEQMRGLQCALLNTHTHTHTHSFSLTPSSSALPPYVAGTRLYWSLIIIMPLTPVFFPSKWLTFSDFYFYQYEQASTPLSVGSIRQQFSLEENILLSRYSYDFIQDIDHHLRVKGEDPVDIQFVDSCYLFLASDKGEKTLRENYQTQRRIGADVELLTPKHLREIYPWMNVCDVTLACRGVCTLSIFELCKRLFSLA